MIKPFEPTASADLVQQNLAQLRELFPEAFAEGKIDFDVLKQLLGGAIDEREEKYGLNWHGKRRARQLALTPSTGTLRPCPGDGVDEETTQNIVIEGDNLEVLKLLQKSYSGKVKLIYIDPPYNTGKDFVYPDNFKDNIKNYFELTGQTNGDSRITSNPESSGRFHTDWLNMMYPRLKMARNLLRDDGAIFTTIDSSEYAHLNSILCDLFGEENWVADIVWNHTKQSKNDEKYFSRHHNVIVVFRRSDSLPRFRFERKEDDNKHYSNPDNDPKGMWRPGDVRSPHLRENLRFKIDTPSGKVIEPPEYGWRWSKDTISEKIQSGEIVFSPDETRIIRKIYLSEQDGRTPENLWLGEFAGTTREANAELKALFGETEPPFDTPKPVSLICKMMELIGDNSCLVLDFFAGSGTTGHAVMAQNAADGGTRRFILVQLPEPLDHNNKDQRTAAEFCDSINKPRTIAELTKERLRRAGTRVRNDNPMFAGDTGFQVFKLDTSNIRVWEPDQSDLNKTLEEAMIHIKSDRTEADILTELLLKLGLDLTVPIETKTIAKRKVHSVGAGVLMVCLDESISRKDAEPLAMGIVKWHQELAPAGESTVVFRDSAFEDDVAKSNLAAILQQHGLTNVRSL